MPNDITFFCYSRNDSHFALRLAKDLRKAGVKVWMDQLDIKPGSHWDASIENGLNTANCLIIVLSPDSIASNNVMDEVSYALESGKRVIPVLLKECNTPFRLRRLQRIDFTKDYNDGFGQLLDTLDYSPGNIPDQQSLADEGKQAEMMAMRSMQEAALKKDKVEKKEAVKEIEENAEVNVSADIEMAEAIAAALTAKRSLSENKTMPAITVNDKKTIPGNFHKQRRMLLIIALIIFGSSFLPWVVFYSTTITISEIYRYSLLGLIFLFVKSAPLVLPFLGKKSEPLKGIFQIIGLVLFIAIIVSAGYSLTNLLGDPYSSMKPGIGAWLFPSSGLAGIVVLTGILKIRSRPNKS